jgi:protoheme IX farnesyltransferase
MSLWFSNRASHCLSPSARWLEWWSHRAFSLRQLACWPYSLPCFWRRVRPGPSISGPKATGQFQNDAVWLTVIVGLLAAAVALAGLSTNWWAALYTFLGAFTYGVVYTIWLKQRTWTNIIVGGLAGSFAVLAGAAAVNPQIGTTALILTVVLFLWTPPHFWSLAMLARDDYAAAGVPMLPVIAGDRVCAWAILGHTLALSILALAPSFYGMGMWYITCAAFGGAWFTWTSIRLVVSPTRSNALRNFFGSLIQLCLLVVGAFLERLIGTVA